MMPVPYSEMKGCRVCHCPLPNKSKKICPCCVDDTRPSKSKTKCLTSVEPLNMIESEYIKNLQLQIYYLEMESKYLWKRSQEQKGSKKIDGSRYKAIGSSGDKIEKQDLARESLGTYARYKYENSGKYDKSGTYDRPRSYDKPSGQGTYKPNEYGTYKPNEYGTYKPNEYGTYKPDSYKTTMYASPGKYDTSKCGDDYKDVDINDNLERLIKNVKNQDAAIKELATEKTKADEMLNMEKQSHARDMHNARGDLVRLRKDLDDERQQRSQCETDLDRLTGNLKVNEESLRQLHLDKSLLDNQMAQRDQHLRSVKSVLEDTRNGLEKREAEINDLQEKYDTSHDLFNRVAGEMREEHKALKEHLSGADLKILELESNRDSLAKTNHRLIEENSSLEQEVTDLQGKLHTEQSVLHENEKQREAAVGKISSMANDIKLIKRELQDSKQKVSDLDSKLHETMENLHAQESTNERLEKRLSSATNRVTELESIRERLATDIGELQDERTSLLDRTSLLESELCYQRAEVEQLQKKSVELKSQLKDVEEIKNLQSSLQTQKWEEFGQLANSMQHLSRCMTQGTTVIIETE